jgi:adenylate cyclase
MLEAQARSMPAAMTGPRLVGLNDEVLGREFALSEQTLIGRNEAADVFLPDLSVSRRHCQIERTASGFQLRDLGSRSGTRLNGVGIRESPLRDQDTLAVGKFLLKFESGISESGVQRIVSGATMSWDETVQAVRLKEIALADFSLAGRVRDVTEQEQLNRLRLHLETVQQVGESIQTTLDLPQLLDVTLVELFRVFAKMDRGFIFLRDPKTSDLAPAATRTRHKDSATVGYSKTVLSYVEKERKAVLSMDASQDERFKQALSVQISSMRTHMCVPLVVRGDCVGAIYLVAGGQESPDGRAFDDEDLALLSSVAGTIAVCVKNAALLAEAQRFAQLSSNLQRYVSVEVTRRLIDRGVEGALGPHLTEGIAMFCDLVGFTNLSERLSPDRIAKLLNRYFHRTLQIVFACGGSVNKFGGDSFLAVWGAIDAAPADLQPAVQAALEAHAATYRLSAELQAEGQPPVQLTVGMNRGRFFAGDIGSNDRMEFTVIGDSVNVASRVQALAHGGQVLAPWDCLGATATRVGAVLYRNEPIRGREGAVTVASIRTLNIETGGGVARWMASLPVYVGPARQPGLVIAAATAARVAELEVLTAEPLMTGARCPLEPHLPEWPAPLPSFEGTVLACAPDELVSRIRLRADLGSVSFADFFGDGRTLEARNPLRKKS